MQCKVCDYRLWNLKARQCPECGTPFCVSDYEFVPNSVQFCCPHCDQPYYGTGHKGHLVPEAFQCVKCGRPVHMNDMVLLPTEGLEEEQTQTFRVPWLERKKVGWFRSYFRMIGLALVSPGKLVRALPADSPAGPAWWFMMVTAFLIPGVWVVPLAVFALLASLTAGGRAAGMAPMAGFLVAGVAAPLFMAVIIAIWGIVAHGLLRLTGQTFAGPSRTYQCLCYSSGANILSVVACFPYVGMIWWLISAVLMLKEGQRVHGGRAAFAALTLPILGGSTLIGLYIWFIVSMMGRMPTATLPATSTVNFGTSSAFTSAQPVFDALQAYAHQHNNQGPQHAIQLVQAGHIKTSDLLLPSSVTTSKEVPVGPTRLDLFDSLPADDQTLAVQQAIDALPTGVIAHRLGDFIFTYHGIDLAKANPNLWILIEWPDPAANRSLSPRSQVTVHQANGMALALPSIVFKEMLRQQNTLRKQYNLPPLPDPSTVTHDKPAAAPAEQPEF